MKKLALVLFLVFSSLAWAGDEHGSWVDKETEIEDYYYDYNYSYNRGRDNHYNFGQRFVQPSQALPLLPLPEIPQQPPAIQILVH